MAISKSTPYVRYKKDFTSSLHLGTIHIESEYLDRTQKTTIESIHGMTWHNKVVNENKELNLLSDTQLELTELEKQYWNTGEKRVSVDEIHTLEEVEPNEDGTYTYTVNSMEGEYIEIYDGINNITSTSDGLDGQFEIVYDTTEEDVNGNIALDQVVSQYEITDSGVGSITSAKSTGLTLVNHITESSKEEVAAIEQQEGRHFTIENTVQGNIKSAILKGNTLVNLCPHYTYSKTTSTNSWAAIGNFTYNLTIGKKYFICLKVSKNTFTDGGQSLYIDGDGKSQYGVITLTGKSGYVSSIFTDSVGAFRICCELTGHTSQGEIEITDIMLIEYQDDMENWDIPYFEGMKSVQMPVLTTVGKNLFDNSKVNKKVAEYLSNGYVKVVGREQESHLDIFEKHYAKDFLKPSTYYTLTVEVLENTMDGLFEVQYGGSVNNGLQGSIYISNGETGKFKQSMLSQPTINDEMIMLSPKLLSQNTSGHIIFRIMIEEGSIATSYESFKSNILTCNEEVELRGVGDVQDELDLITGELTQRVGEVVLDGSLTWVQNTDWSAGDYYACYTTSIKDKITGDKNLRTSNFSVGRDIIDRMAMSEFICGESSNHVIYVVIAKSKLTPDDSGEYKIPYLQYLNANPITVQYQLATESIKTVDLTVQNQDGGTIPRIQTQQGITHVSTSSYGLIPTVEMSCSYDTIIKPNTTYTIKLDRPIVSDTMYLQVDLGGTMMMLDADVNAFTIKTPSTLSHSQLRLSGTGNTVKEIIVLEGNRVNDKIEYFEGMKNVENPILIVNNCPYVFGKGGRK